MPGYSGRKPPAPPPHTSSGKGPCSYSIVGMFVISIVWIMDKIGV